MEFIIFKYLFQRLPEPSSNRMEFMLHAYCGLTHSSGIHSIHFAGCTASVKTCRVCETGSLDYDDKKGNVRAVKFSAAANNA